MVSWVRLWWYKSRALTQYELNQLFKGPRFLLDFRYPFLLTTVFVTLAFSSALPILLPIATCGLFLTYWNDKVLLLRVVSTERLDGYDGHLGMMSLKIMRWAIVLHLAMSCRFYSVSSVFYDVSELDSAEKLAKCCLVVVVTGCWHNPSPPQLAQPVPRVVPAVVLFHAELVD